MKKYIKSATILFAALSVIGCSKVEELNSNPDSALQIESVGGVSQYALMQAQPASKAVIDGNTLPGSEAAQGIGIFVTASDGSAYDGHDKGYSNVEYAYNGSKWSTTTPIYLSNTVGKLYGYFPYNAGATNLKAIPIASSLNGTDYLYTEQREVSISNKSVSLQMNHALARLHLTLKKGEKYKAAGVISGITLKSTAIDATGTMDITTGEVTATKAKTDKGVVELAASGSLSTGDQTYDILLVPADGSDAATPFDILISIDGTTAGVTLSGENGITIQSGKQYDVTLEIDASGVKVTAVGVGAWDKQGSQKVNVGEHTITVKFSSNTEDIGITDDVLTAIKVDGSNVMIEAYSKSQKRRIGCYLDGVASCKTRTNTIFHFNPIAADEINLISYIFTISDISSDITATIGYPRPEKIELFESYITYAGYPLKFNAAVLPNDALNKNVTWSTNNPSVAEVDANGRVTTKAVGTANITATTVVGGITATCAVTVKPAEELILSSEFSVGPADNCKKVRFSRGNLRYTTNPESWCFFDNQYEQGHGQNQISLFTWGYGSWSTDWRTTSYESGNFTDWGTKIGNGSTWRTLKSDEWAYLLEGRKDAADKVGYATVCEMHGVLLLPDEFEDPKTNESNSSDCVEKKFVPKSSKGWEQNIYSSGDSWNKMQAAGAVFLPAAGFRNGSPGLPAPAGVSDVGLSGFYWSASPDVDYDAYDLSFVSVNVFPHGSDARVRAQSVRLVTESE